MVSIGKIIQYKSIDYTSILVLHMSKSKSVPFSLPFSDMCPVIGWATNTWLLRTLAASVSCRASPSLCFAFLSPFDSPCLRYLSPTFVAWFLNCCWLAGVRSWSSFSCQRKHEHGGDQIRAQMDQFHLQAPLVSRYGSLQGNRCTC